MASGQPFKIIGKKGGRGNGILSMVPFGNDGCMDARGCWCWRSCFGDVVLVTTHAGHSVLIGAAIVLIALRQWTWFKLIAGLLRAAA